MVRPYPRMNSKSAEQMRGAIKSVGAKAKPVLKRAGTAGKNTAKFMGEVAKRAFSMNYTIDRTMGPNFRKKR